MMTRQQIFRCSKCSTANNKSFVKEATRRTASVDNAPNFLLTRDNQNMFATTVEREISIKERLHKLENILRSIADKRIEAFLDKYGQNQ